MRGRPVNASGVILSRVMHPNEASYMGTGHGGVILRMIDEAGGVAAFRHARKPVVTAAIDSMSFLAPVYVGNLVTAKASVNSVGKTSMEVGVRVEADRRRMAEAELRREARAARPAAWRGRAGR